MTAPLSRRELWLTIALAVARDGLPEPSELKLYIYDDGKRIARLTCERWSDAARWGDWLGTCQPPEWQDHGHGQRSVYYWGQRDGWTWNFDATELAAADDSDLAAQVVAAILTPDAAVPA